MLETVVVSTRQKSLVRDDVTGSDNATVAIADLDPANELVRLHEKASFVKERKNWRIHEDQESAYEEDKGASRWVEVIAAATPRGYDHRQGVAIN